VLTVLQVRHLGVLLRQHHNHLLNLKTLWSNPYATTMQFDEYIHAATEVARNLAGGSPLLLPTLTQPDIAGNVDALESDQAPSGQMVDSEAVIVADLLGAEPDDESPTSVDSDINMVNHDVEIIWNPSVSSLQNSLLHPYSSYPAGSPHRL
jgi:hypothetical protein